MTQTKQATSGGDKVIRSAHPANVVIKGGSGNVYSGLGDLQALPAAMAPSPNQQTPGTPAPSLTFPDDTFYQGFPSPYGSVLVAQAATQPDYYPVALVCNTGNLKGTIYFQQSYLSPEPAGWPAQSPYRQTVMVAFNDGQKDVVMPILDYVPRWNSWGAVRFVSSGDAKNSHVLNASGPGSSRWSAGPYDKFQSFSFNAKYGDTIAIIGVAADAWNVGGGGIGCYNGVGEWGGGPIVDGTERNGVSHTWVFVGGDTVFQAGASSRSMTYTVSHGTSLTNSWKLSLMLGATVKEGAFFASATQTTQLTTEYSGSYTVTDQTTISESYSMGGDPNFDSRAGMYQLYDAYGVNMPRVMSYFDYITKNLPRNTYDLKCNGTPCTLSDRPLGQCGFGFEQPIAYLPTQDPGGQPNTQVTAMVHVWKYCSAADNRQCKQAVVDGGDSPAE